MAQPSLKSSVDGRDEKLVIRVSPALRRQMEALATRHERSLSGEVRMAMLRYVEAEAA